MNPPAQFAQRATSGVAAFNPARVIYCPAQRFASDLRCGAIEPDCFGELCAAAKAGHKLLELRPGFTAKVREDIQKWWDIEYVESFIDGLRKAGLEIVPV